MKILHVIPSMDPKQGGVCQALRTMISGLADQNIYNEVVSLDNSESPFLLADKFIVHAIGDGKGPWFYNSRLKSWFLSNLSYFDTVIMHGLWQYPGFALRQAIKSLSKLKLETSLPKIFVMPHGMLDPYFQTDKKRRLKALRNIIYWKVIESRLINEADGLLFTCEEELNLASLPFKPYAPKRKFIIGLGVENPPPYTESMEIEFLKCCPQLRKAPYLLFLSRIHEKKGVDILLDAYSHLLQSIEDKPRKSNAGLLPKLIIAGPGLDSAYGKKMYNKVAEDSLLSTAVIFPGMLIGDAKWGAFYGCEAFVLPSHQENFGIAVVEALACNKPVLISNQVNIWREIKEDGACYVSNDTIEGAIKMLESWIGTGYKQKQAMRRNALYAYEKNFSIEPATDRLLKALAETN
ncbi:glycosyltransferase [Pedobacter mucosus]|uniref:glycosyltransferase n=1 Tax=Pedobacter mucosus TaxID=2895286 RepID=UPI001EE3CA51|nr:glycosyltransferase [Pedobacter mucosus]UKT62238.1 glycosyltransferase [Pedobacter mucosus]